MPDYSELDKSPLVGFLFYPRADLPPVRRGPLISSYRWSKGFPSPAASMWAMEAGPGFYTFTATERW